MFAGFCHRMIRVLKLFGFRVQVAVRKSFIPVNGVAQTVVFSLVHEYVHES